MMLRHLPFVVGIAVLGSAAVHFTSSDAASFNPHRKIGREGFSEVYVPQVRGRVPASATSAKSLSPKSLPEGRAAANASGTTSPETCGPQNADTAACRNTAAQQSHR